MIDPVLIDPVHLHAISLIGLLVSGIAAADGKFPKKVLVRFGASSSRVAALLP